MKGSYENRIYLRFIGWVSLVLVIPIIGMLFIFNTSFDVISRQLYEKNVTVLADSAQNINRLFNNVNNLFLYISESSSVNNFLNMDSSAVMGTGISEMLKTQKDLKALSIANDYITNIQIYSPKNAMLMDSGCTAMYLDRYYGKMFTKAGYSLKQWKADYLDSREAYRIYPNADYIYSNVYTESILYTKNIQSSGYPTTDGKVLIYLDRSMILTSLHSLVPQNRGFTYVLNEDGGNFFHSNPHSEDTFLSTRNQFEELSGYYFEKIEQQEFLITYYKNLPTGWVYISAVTEDYLLSMTNHARLTIITLILLTIALGVSVALYSAKKLSKPIENLCSVFFKNNINAQYEDFSTQISKLLRDNRQMQGEIQKHIPALKADLFHSLLTGSFASSDEIKTNMAKLDVQLQSEFYLVLVVSLNELDTQSSIETISAQKLYINSLIPRIIHRVVYTYDLDFERSAFLIAYSAATREMIVEKSEEAVKEILAVLEKEASISISFSGDIAKGEKNISTAFCNAYTALYYRKKEKERAIQWYRNMTYEDKNAQSYYLEAESKIISAVSRGDSEQVFALLSEIEKKNYDVLNSQNYAISHAFLDSMNAILTKILEYEEGQRRKAIPFLRHIPEQMKNLDEAFSSFFLIKESLIYLAEEKKKELYLTQGTLQEQIKGYVDANFTNPQISLSSVASMFGITDVYLSSIFKQIVGDNFSKYMEKLRMEKAQQLIQEGICSINDISEQIGYNSLQVFRRAYKRYYGVSPVVKK